jgi:hypothetical protein
MAEPCLVEGLRSYLRTTAHERVGASKQRAVHLTVAALCDSLGSIGQSGVLPVVS